jgi:beta-glucosidase-like glycosyl hydrolase/CubicO group peptidase (beta-lactamase class C family)
VKVLLIAVGLSTLVLALVNKLPLTSQIVTKKTFKSNLSEDQWVAQQLASLSLDDKIAQSFMVACWSNSGPEHTAVIDQQINDYHIGGIIFFQGERTNLVEQIDHFQQQSQLPLLLGMDAEWGIAMRISGEERFPYAQTIGAANDLSLTEQIGEHMGIECEMAGIHLNFAPVADVNSNPSNPVIGFRSFGSGPDQVAKHTSAFVSGMAKTSVLSCVKHFPGHGDTDKDSHKELPTVTHSESEFKTVDFVPFKAGISAGTDAVMVAHLNVPKLDNSGTPSSLSKKIIQGYLRKELGFKGLVISDALNMKAVADRYGASEVVAKAYIAGCDVLLYPESIRDAITLIKQKINTGELDLSDVNARCSNVLRAKYKAIISKPQVKRKDPQFERELVMNQVFEKAITVIKNDHELLPFNRLDTKIIRIGIGPYDYNFNKRLTDYAPIENHHYFTVEEAKERIKKVHFPKDAMVIVDLHATTQRARDHYGFGNWHEVLSLIPTENKVVLTLFGNPMVLKENPSLPESVDACVLAYENHPKMQDRVAQFIMGAFDAKGTLQEALSDHWKKGFGITVKGNGRLKHTLPEELGISRSKLGEIDNIVQNAIEAKALPGCQIVVAIEGKIIYEKCFGKTMYEGGDSITMDHIYDIASITKIASSTVALMKLKSEGKFNENKTLGELTPEFVTGTNYASLKAIDLLTHQAGLTPWIAFYKKTLTNGELDPAVYSTVKKDGFTKQVAAGIFIKDDYWKVMIKTITDTPLSGEKKYEYSDLSYYFFKAYIERITGKSQDAFVQSELYAPLGLQHMTYLPILHFPLRQIVPTENDQEFRKQVVQGYVHDPGAAMMGGVAGHAGLFSNALDLAALMEVLIQKGQVGSYNLIDPAVVKQFTSCQFCPGNRRGIGFDKPTVSKSDGPTSAHVSSETFGHSGFTGTITWADPVFKVNYVFLSNRVYPDASNKKITNMSVRNRIQDVIYEALFQAKKQSK